MNEEVVREDDDRGERKEKRLLRGTVVSDKADRTITVLVERKVRHPVYGKYVRRSTKYHVHDADNHGRQGDLVAIAECRPVSKTKSWRLVDVVERAR